mgnify:CR=1 FL=1
MNVDKLNWLARHGDIWALWRERAALLFAESGEELRKPTMPKVSGTVAVMPLTGTLTQAGDDWFGGTSTDAFGRAFDAAMAHQNIAGIVIKIDSPGGSVYGTQALADKVFTARGSKPVVAIADSLAASAAYWVGTAAEKFVVTPHGDVGSIGVWSAHEDISKMLEKMGVNITLVSAGKFKVEGHPFGPLDAEAKGEMQRRVDSFYSDFIDAVAKQRGVRASAVRNGFGMGRVVNAKEAAEEGMVDGVMSLDEVLRGMVGSVRKQTNKAAALEAEQEIHAAYVGAFIGPEEGDEDDEEGDDALAAQQAREKRVAELRASQREERLKEMEAVWA